MDEFSEKVQTAFDPLPPHFQNFSLQICHKMNVRRYATKAETFKSNIMGSPQYNTHTKMLYSLL